MKHIYSAVLALVAQLCFAQDNNTWTTKEDFAGPVRYLGTSFAIGTKIFSGTGLGDDSEARKDMWQYDVAGDSWTQKNDFEGAKRIGSIGFTINGKGYIGLGGDLAGNMFTDLWEYDPATDDWTKKADFPGVARTGAVVFIVDNKAYIGTGQGVANALADLWEYDPSNNTWTQKANLPATPRVYAAAFAIGSKGYVGTGLNDNENELYDFWEYNPANDQWTRKADSPLQTAGGIGFATSTRGYLGLGSSFQLFSYYPNENGWVRESNFPTLNAYVNASCAFADGKAYVGIGFPTMPGFYSYTPGIGQSITFDAFPTKTFGDADFDLNATATSSLTVEFMSTNTSVATISGKTVTIVGAGTATIIASREGDGTFDAAVPVERTLTVNKANQAITFNALDGKNVNDAPFDLGATTTSPLTVAYSSSNTDVAAISGKTVTIVGAGTTTITASQPGNTNYNAATSVPRDLVISKLTQSITFGALDPMKTSDAPLELTGTATSGLAVSYSSSNTAVATISGITLTIVAAGNTTITASQAGNATYSAAASVAQPLVVTKGLQTWIGDLPTTAGYSNKRTLTLHLSSGLAYNLTSSNTSVATVALEGSDWVVTPLTLGTTTLTASNAGNANFEAAPVITSELVVGKGTQTITLADIPVLTVDNIRKIPLVPRASSGLPVTLEVDAEHFEVVIFGNSITAYNAFNGTITARQAGNEFYEPAELAKNITVQKAESPITMEPFPEMKVGDPPFRPTIVMDQYVTLTSGNPDVAKIVDGKVQILATGTATIFAERAETAGYKGTVASQVLKVKEFNAVEFAALTDKSVNDPPFDIFAGSTSGLPVTFVSSDPNIATISGNTVTITGVGSVMITASAGNDTYVMASTTQVLHVKNVDQTPSEQGQFWGVQQYGGSQAIGLIYKTNGDGTGIAVVKEFQGATESGTGSGVLSLAPNGKLYGVSRNGGIDNAGTIFEYDPATDQLSKKYDFENFDNLMVNWLLTPGGKIYGAKSLGEGDEFGPFIYEFDTETGTISKLKSVYGGLNSIYDMFMSTDGIIYAIGAVNLGGQLAVIEYDPASNSFIAKGNGAISVNTIYGMAEAANGKFYGTSQYGGDNNEGYIVEFDPVAGTVTQKISFEKADFNTTTAQGLMRASSGKLYGIAQWGGADRGGYIYEYNPETNSIVKLAFMPLGSGNGVGKLIEASNGRFYGSGNPGLMGGHVFEFNPATNEVLTLIDIQSAPIRSIVGTMVVGNDNKLYGVASAGGANGAGSLIEFNYETLTLTSLFDFGGFPEGTNPRGGVTPATNGKLYGVTQYGGTYDGGILYEIDPETDAFTKVIDLGGAIGVNPRAPLTAGANGKLYGTTISGGVWSMGTLFELDPNTKSVRVVVDLYNNNSTGVGVYDYMAQTTNGLLYTVTQYGGDLNLGNNGTLLEVNPSTKAFKILKDFNTADGLNPSNGVMVASNGKLYGTITDGGANSKGVLFEYDISEAKYTVKHDFDTSAPTAAGSLTELNGKLYGTLQAGGANGNGAIFEYDLESGEYTVKYEFTDASMPSGRLHVAANGKMYGTTRAGSPGSGGIIFEFDPATGVVTRKSTVPLAVSYALEPLGALVQTTKAYRTNQVITIDTIEDKVYGDGGFVPTVTVSSGLQAELTGSANLRIEDGVVSMNAPGKATLTANQPGNASYNAAAEVQSVFCVNPKKPTITATQVNVGTVELTSSNAEGNQWFKDGVAIAAATNVKLELTQPGIYTVQSTVDECVGETSNAFPIIVTGDIDAATGIAIYPNPVREKLYIQLPGGNLKHVTLLQADGRIAEEHHTAAKILEIDVRSYSAGLYLVRIADETGNYPVIKFIIQ